MAMEKINGSDDDSFAKLPAYINSIKHFNPGSHALLRIVEGQFYSMYASYFSSIVGFQHCRPLIALDGTHLTSNGIGIDAEGHIFNPSLHILHTGEHDVDGESGLPC
ncbi:hypothetical protein V1520DRAFT_123056 [Lipomyces starkeyi]